MAFQDGDNESADLKKPSTQGRTSTTKRTRAAEVHNLSERVGFEPLVVVHAMVCSE
jgi:hypothetical protein